MGKSKKRLFNKTAGKNAVNLKRQDVIDKIISDIKNNNLCSETLKYIGFFGITSEELSEMGVSYEELSAIKHLLL